MEDLLNSKDELLRLAEGCASNYNYNREDSAFLFDYAKPKSPFLEERELLPSIIGSKNIHKTADCMIKAISAVTYKIGTLAQNLDTKLSQLSDTIMFLDQDVKQVQIQIAHAVEGGYHREFQESFGHKEKKPKMEKFIINNETAGKLGQSPTFKCNPIDYSILDNISTVKKEERKRTESLKEAYENVFNAMPEDPRMSIRNSVSSQDKHMGQQSRLKKVDIPLMNVEIPQGGKMEDEPPPSSSDNTYLNLNELDETQDTYAAFDKLLYDMSLETDQSQGNVRESIPLPPPPNDSDYALIDDLSDDEDLPPPISCEYLLPELSDDDF